MLVCVCLHTRMFACVYLCVWVGKRVSAHGCVLWACLCVLPCLHVCKDEWAQSCGSPCAHTETDVCGCVRDIATRVCLCAVCVRGLMSVFLDLPVHARCLWIREGTCAVCVGKSTRVHVGAELPGSTSPLNAPAPLSEEGAASPAATGRDPRRAHGCLLRGAKPGPPQVTQPPRGRAGPGRALSARH